MGSLQQSADHAVALCRHIMPSQLQHRQRPATAFIHFTTQVHCSGPAATPFFFLFSSLVFPKCEEGRDGEGVRQRLLKYSGLSLSTLSINYQNMCEHWKG